MQLNSVNNAGYGSSSGGVELELRF